MAKPRSELVTINKRYLKSAGWREVEPGKWLPKGQRINRKRPGLSPFYSLTGAIARQMSAEVGASLEAEFGTRGRFVAVA